MVKPRFCVKGGRVFWSASPKVEAEIVPTGPAPFDGQLLTVSALRAIAHDHFRALRKAGGRPADLKGAGLEPEAVVIAAQRCDHPAWVQILETADGSVRAAVRVKARELAEKTAAGAKGVQIVQTGPASEAGGVKSTKKK